MFVVVRPPFFQHFVTWGKARCFLGFFLKEALGVAEKFFGNNFSSLGQDVFFNKFLGRQLTPVEINGAD